MSEPFLLHSGAELTFAELPALGRHHFGDLPVAVDDRIAMSYREFDERSARFAAGLLRAGLRPGDAVALWMTNRVEWLVAQFGIYRAGGRLVPISTQYQADELSHILADSRATMLVYEPRFLGRYDARQVLADAVARRGDEFALRGLVCLGEPTSDGEIDYACVAAAEPTGRALGLAPRAAVDIMYTSGTTGLPKGVLLSAHGLLTTYARVARNAKLTETRSRWLLNVPLSTMFGCAAILLPCLLTGGSMVLRPRFDAADALTMIEAATITHLAGSPTMYSLLLERAGDRGVPADTLRGGMIAGAVASPELVRTLIERVGLVELVNMFGQTEGCGTASMTRPDDPMEKRLHTVGRPLSHVELAIRDLGGAGPCPPGVAGEVLGRGRAEGVHTFLGYQNLPDRTAEAVDSDGWLHYGDIGTLDADGYLSVGAGRLKEMYVSGGYNVYPPEVERILTTHPDVERATVFGVPDGRFGEVGVAYVTVTQGSQLSPNALRDWCRTHMAHYKVPSEVVFEDDLPLTASGKVQRSVLRQGWVAGHGSR